MACLYVLALLCELAGLALVVAGVREQRREGRRLVAEAETIHAEMVKDPVRLVGFAGTAMTNDWLLRRYTYDARLAGAGALAGARRQLVGALLVAAGLVLGTTADLLSL